MEDKAWKQMYLYLAASGADTEETVEPMLDGRAWTQLNQALQEAEQLYKASEEEL